MNKPIHFRRCHNCGEVNIREQNKVEYCLECGKALAQFFYFDDRLTPTPSDKHLRPPLARGEVQPIQGLTVYWEGY